MTHEITVGLTIILYKFVLSKTEDGKINQAERYC